MLVVFTSSNSNRIKIERIVSESFDDLSEVYKQVFSGFPWYEDKVCSGIRLPISNLERCSIQYTSRSLPVNYGGKLSQDRREGVVGDTLFDKVKDCTTCGRELINFYPDFVDQKELIKEATEKPGFIGFILREEGLPIGFSWGYKLPRVKTSSVNFPIILPKLNSKGINLEKTFYGAELGVIENKQKRGLGLLASSVRLREANKEGYESFLIRTKNEAVLAILRRIFSGKKEEYLFDDSERKTPYYRWDFRDFDNKEVERIINSFIQ